MNIYDDASTTMLFPFKIMQIREAACREETIQLGFVRSNEGCTCDRASRRIAS